MSPRIAEWTATYLPDGSPPGTVGTTLQDGVTILPEGEATVRWPANAVQGVGHVIVRMWDQAGNIGRASLRIRIRDRRPPVITQSNYRREAARRRIRAWITCDEPGTANITLRASGRRPRPALNLKVRKGARRTVVFRNVPVPAAFQLEYTCFDRAQNQSLTRYRFDLIGF
jgi:hypothetical protein